MENIFIRIRNEKFTHYHAFSQSATGTLDYMGKTENPDIDGLQEIETSHYFSPSRYAYLPKALQSEIHVLFGENVNFADANLFGFLTHVGALLLAVEENDGLLVAELLHRRAKIFFAFLPLTLYIIKPIAPLALFAWVYGRFSQSEGFQKMFELGISSPTANADEILFAAASKTLAPNPEKETADEMFIRYLKTLEHGEFTIGIVGGNHHFWDSEIIDFDAYLEKAIENDLLNGTFLARKRKFQLLSELEVSLQAEPYNPYDPNAIGVSIESIRGKLSGSGGKSKAGYIRATGAAILRKAFPRKFAYEAKLARLVNPLHPGVRPSSEEIFLHVEF